MSAVLNKQNDFALRLERIASASRARTQRVFVGEDESYVVPRHEWKHKASGATTALGNAMYPLSLVLAVVVGIVAHGVTMVARYYIDGLPDWNANPNIEMFKQLVMAYVLAMVVGYLIGLRSSTLTALKVLGCALGVLAFHNAVHMYPDLFAKLTSQLWVAQMIAHTKAHSLLFRGISFIL